jgi:hypothetical protein
MVQNSSQAVLPPSIQLWCHCFYSEPKSRPHMTETDLRDQVAGIEDNIERLRQTIDECRKTMPLAKTSIVVGAAWAFAYFVGELWFNPAIMIGTIAGTLGGIVALGASSRTLADTKAALEEAERRKIQLQHK